MKEDVAPNAGRSAAHLPIGGGRSFSFVKIAIDKSKPDVHNLKRDFNFIEYQRLNQSGSSLDPPPP